MLGKHIWTLSFFWMVLLSCKKEDNSTQLEQLDTLNKKPITIEAGFMQYACGDWNDDMKVKATIDTIYNFLLGKDVDPLFLNAEEEIADLLLKNETEEYGFRYSLQGYVSSCAKYGCGDDAPKFWITKIERLDGKEFDRSIDN